MASPPAGLAGSSARALCCLALVVAGGAAAQSDTPDASMFPTQSVGQGGADHTSPETEDASSTCTFDTDCEHGFSCRNGKCSWNRIRDATFEGCAAAPGGLAAAALAAALRRRRRRLPAGRR